MAPSFCEAREDLEALPEDGRASKLSCLRVVAAHQSVFSFAFPEAFIRVRRLVRWPVWARSLL